jgi:hypothetical protein
MIQFEGDHNSQRPDYFYDNVANFFYNVLVSKDKEMEKNKKEEKEIDLTDEINEEIKELKFE